ncbi:MAG: M15 family metallopeptidase [Bacteroidota bacterium]
MRYSIWFLLFALPQVGFFLGCGGESSSSKMAVEAEPKMEYDSSVELSSNEESIIIDQEPQAKLEAPDSNLWTDIQLLETSIMLDIRYATDNNFMEEQIYDCGRCWLRPDVADAVVRVHNKLAKQGLGLKMYDCYRPAPYQQRLWDKVPDPRYVANPARGSVHGRGAAVDLTLVDLETGEELDMGTDYDFFGPAAHSAATNLPAEVLKNRQILQDAMRAEGFLTIRTEWWHFNFSGPRYPLSDELWKCE